MPFAERLPFATILRAVSGKRAIITRQSPDDTVRSQKIDRQVQRSRSRPLITGPTLGGGVQAVISNDVFSVVSLLNSWRVTYKNDMMPE